MQYYHPARTLSIITADPTLSVIFRIILQTIGNIAFLSYIEFRFKTNAITNYRLMKTSESACPLSLCAFTAQKFHAGAEHNKAKGRKNRITLRPTLCPAGIIQKENSYLRLSLIGSDAASSCEMAISRYVFHVSPHPALSHEPFRKDAERERI